MEAKRSAAVSSRRIENEFLDAVEAMQFIQLFSDLSRCAVQRTRHLLFGLVVADAGPAGEFGRLFLATRH